MTTDNFTSAVPTSDDIVHSEDNYSDEPSTKKAKHELSPEVVPTSDIVISEDDCPNEVLNLVTELEPEKTISEQTIYSSGESDSSISDDSDAEDDVDNEISIVDDTSFSIYDRFYKHPNRLTPLQLPGRPKYFQAYLKDVFKSPERYIKEREAIYSASGCTSVFSNARTRAFVATCFPPVQVGNFAGSCIDITYEGDIFPQFTQLTKSNFRCSICTPYLKWAIRKQPPAFSV